MIIDEYVLQVSPILVTNWQDVTTFVASQSTALQHTLTTDADPIISYEKYRFRIKAMNAYGSSEWSPTIDLAVAPLPTAPEAPLKLQQLST